ncbi:holo-acyl-carrier-protein synthase [Dethiosulfovibrio peptidovorans DSM 11002]|uniref:Holo-[acyl-carrier-protein] synthase n=1 Tax=Dethiosulfovibrio peptidovorans DSM 11002 TaxID=469381 RepID=D2Z381_9BACT|nr:holo-ACP synthase [Dethiosulfovibrio peptidovorans]EFC92121.1 holo-acyl-carrier-protein synthase [Dethiosulfovibrio peptidovorans DSM 11002]
MVLGIGVDLCRVSRLARCIENDRFLKRVFSPEEIDYAMSRPVPARHLAASFAAREAFSKASGVHLAKVVFQGVWVSRTEKGPFIRLDGLSPEIGQYLGENRFHLSLSHDGDYALAFVVMEEGPYHENLK